MQPENLNFGGGVADSAVSPIALGVILLVGILICVRPRTKVIGPFLAAGILIPYDQVLVLGGVHFPMIRLLAVFGFVRLARAKFSGKEKVFSGGMNGIDWAVIVLTLFITLDGVLLWQSTSQLVYQLGNILAVFGVYFLLRYLIRDEADVKQALRTLAVVAFAVGLLMTYEHATGRNPYFALLGGARPDFSTAIDRADAFRARGVFAHPNLAGSFGGFILPLFVGWWGREKSTRKWAGLGIIGALTIPIATGSSTALFALIGGLIAFGLWPLRGKMKLIRWGIVATLGGLQCVMKSPVWHIISDVSLSQDSSSYHRYMLVDQCIRHFFTWALIGTKDYGNWGWDMWDLSNQYVGTADTAGLIPFIALLAILVYGFKYVGRMRRVAEREGDKNLEFFVWALGASLFGNVVAFMGISYFDQTIVPWYMVLAMISAMTMAVWSRQAAAAKVGGAERVELEAATVGMGFGSRPAFRPVRDARAGAGLQAVGNGSKRGQ